MEDKITPCRTRDAESVMFYPLFLQAVDNISLKTSKILLLPNWYFRLDMHCGNNRLSVDMLRGPVGDKSGIYGWLVQLQKIVCVDEVVFTKRLRSDDSRDGSYLFPSSLDVRR